MQTAIAIPKIPVGDIRTFGALGPKYEVGKPLRPLNDYDWLIEVTVLESGERVEYPLSNIQDDPKAV